MGRVEGKVALVTGAGHGQGRAHALRLAEEGADIIAVDVCHEVSPYVGYSMSTEAELAETARLVEDQDRRVLARQADVRDFAQLSAVVSEALAELGKIDVVVANAGIISYHWGWEIPEDAWDAIIDVNLKGVWNTLRATVPSMIERGEGGSIIITSSAAGIRGLPLMAHYTASKFGVVGLMKTFSNELGPHNIRVNTVHPTGVDSDGMGRDPNAAKVFEQYPEVIGPIATNTLQSVVTTMIDPRDISNAVLWLASDEARYVTGVQLPVDAGNTTKA